MNAFSEVFGSLESAKELGKIDFYSAGISQFIIPDPTVNLLGGNQWIDWIMYPTETIFDSMKLNQILFDVCPIQFMPSAVKQFEDRGFRMDFGYIKCFQKLGQAKHTMTTEFEIDDEAGLIDKINHVYRSSTTELNRRVMVYLLPNKEIAEILYPRDDNYDDLQEIPVGLSRIGIDGQLYTKFKTNGKPQPERLKFLARVKNIISKAA